MQLPGYLTVKEAAAELGLSVVRVKQFVAADKFVTQKLHNSLTLIERDSFDAFKSTYVKGKKIAVSPVFRAEH